MCANPSKALCCPDPEVIVYGGVTADRIESIRREYVVERVPIETWVVRSYHFGYAATTAPEG